MLHKARKDLERRKGEANVVVSDIEGRGEGVGAKKTTVKKRGPLPVYSLYVFNTRIALRKSPDLT
jgi:hypothetical protein